MNVASAENFWQNLPKPFLILAPMEGVTDVVFRQVVAKAGRPDVFFTEFTNVSSFASEKGKHDALERLDIAGLSSRVCSETLKTDNSSDSNTPRKNLESPIVAQIWGKNPEHFGETAAALSGLGFSGLDINMGCPDKHVNKAGGGAAMIKTPELAVECIAKAREKTSLPISVKTRLGFTYVEEYKTWLPLLFRQNLAALTVHLRTRKEMSKVPAHYELIPEIVKFRDEISPDTKLIINGDIMDKNQALELSLKYPGVDGFMIGRGVFQNPYCFTSHKPSREELTELFLYHLDLFDLRAEELSERGSRYPYEPLKHFIKIYFSGFDGSKELRARMMECRDTRELREVIK